MLLKVGELAKRTGLTVRTLHHYDEAGHGAGVDQPATRPFHPDGGAMVDRHSPRAPLRSINDRPTAPVAPFGR